jgi:hypothetical protein
VTISRNAVARAARLIRGLSEGLKGVFAGRPLRASGLIRGGFGR